MNFEKFKKLSMKEKIQWLLQYYGLAVCLVAVAVVIIVIFVKSVFIPEPVSDIRVMILSNHVSADDAVRMQDELETITGKSVDIIAYNATDAYGRDAFAIKLTSDQLDIVIAPANETEQMIQTGYLREKQQIGALDLYLGIPQNARPGDALHAAVQYLKKAI